MTDTINALFENVVANRKDKIAVIENNRTLTFGELSNLVDIIAESFPVETTSVGIVMQHRAEMIASMLAVLKCGARYVPAEPTFPTGRIQYMMKEAQVDFILTEKEHENKLDGFPLRLVDCEICGVELPVTRKMAAQPPELPAYVLYTSGTTGTSQRSLCYKP